MYTTVTTATGHTVDTRKRLDDDGDTAQVAGLQGSVLARRALAVVLVADNHPLDTSRLVLAARQSCASV